RAAVFTASATLAPGENGIQVRLRNAWKELTTSKILVSYRLPPRLLSLQSPAKASKPYAELVALVESVQNIPLTRVKIQDKEVPLEALSPVVAERKGDRTIWKLTARDEPLRKGRNRIEMQVSNRDGWTLKPAVQEMDFEE